MSEVERGAYEKALNGSIGSTQSCVGRGEAAGADAIVGPATQRLGELHGELMVRVRSDRRVSDALAEWQACIRQAGLSYESRDDIIISLKLVAEEIPSMTDATQSAQSIESLQSRAAALAMIDVHCDESAGLERVTHEVQLAQERKLADSEAVLVSEVQQERTRLLGSGTLQP